MHHAPPRSRPLSATLCALALLLAACSGAELIDGDATVDPAEPDASAAPEMGSVDPGADASPGDLAVPPDAAPDPIDAAPDPIDAAPDPIDAAPDPIDAASDPIDATPGPLDATPDPIDAALDPIDAAPEPLAACAELSAHPGWTACLDAPDRCEGVFDDGLGCAAWCARAGLRCAAVYENIDDVCEPDLARPALACSPGSGHDSDYCVCEPGEPLRPWEDLAGAAIGYGRAATGGLGGEICLVDALGDAGPGTLRACAERPEPLWIRFAVSGDINLQSMIQVQSDKTIDGRGAAIRIRNRGLRLSGVHNVILHGFRLDDGGGDNEDAIQIINGTRDVWVDHLTIEDFTDGALDITAGATHVTVSWCRFRDHDKTMLIGASVDHVDDTAIRVTLHHNWFDGTNQRHPRLRYGKVHIFNNYYRDWGSYGIGSSQRGEVRSQRNIFEAGDDRDAITTQVGSDPDPGRVRSDNDWRLNGARIDERQEDDVFEPRDDYAYMLEEADEALRDRIRAEAGFHEVPAP